MSTRGAYCFGATVVVRSHLRCVQHDNRGINQYDFVASEDPLWSRLLEVQHRPTVRPDGTRRVRFSRRN